MQYNNLNIGDGFVISVSRASFTPPVSVKEDVDDVIEPVSYILTPTHLRNFHPCISAVWFYCSTICCIKKNV